MRRADVDAVSDGHRLRRRTGSLLTLRSSGGNFSTATTNCLGNDLADDDASTTSSGPAAGQGFWYLLRAVNCGGGASYNSGAPTQVGIPRRGDRRVGARVSVTRRNDG